MGLFSKFSKKPEEPQTHEEPGMSRSLNNDVVNKEFAGREPGFNQPKNPLNSTTQILRTSPAETQKLNLLFLNPNPRLVFFLPAPEEILRSLPCRRLLLLRKCLCQHLKNSSRLQERFSLSRSRARRHRNKSILLKNNTDRLKEFERAADLSVR